MARKKYTYSEMFAELVAAVVTVETDYDPDTEMFKLQCGNGQSFAGVDLDHTIESAWLWVVKNERPEGA